MSIGTFLLAFLTGAIVLPIALLLSPQLPDIQTVTAYLPAVSVAGVIVFGYKLVKRLIAGGGGRLRFTKEDGSIADISFFHQARTYRRARAQYTTARSMTRRPRGFGQIRPSLPCVPRTLLGQLRVNVRAGL
jgi:hypothetical protein